VARWNLITRTYEPVSPEPVLASDDRFLERQGIWGWDIPRFPTGPSSHEGSQTCTLTPIQELVPITSGVSDAFNQAPSPSRNGLLVSRTGRILLRPYTVNRSCPNPHRRDTRARLSTIGSVDIAVSYALTTLILHPHPLKRISVWSLRTIEL
jgi:hypothetical protein